MDELNKYRKSLEFLDSYHQQAIATLIKWSEINSGSYNFTGLAEMHDILVKKFSLLGGVVNTIKADSFEVIDSAGNLTLQQTGNILTIKKRWDSPNRVLLCGHMDTVFPKNSPFQKVNKMANHCLNGPGVADMKGGLLVMFYALSALEASPFAQDLGWQVVINADEEIGSLGSASFLDSISREADIGLVYEPSMTPDGIFAGQRKGSGKFSIIVTGLSAHAGRDFYQGHNAICHLSALIKDINQLNNPNSQLTINVGLMQGGTALNVVPDKAIAKLDVRFGDKLEQDLFITQIDKLIEKYNQVKGFSVVRHGDFSRPPKPLTKQTLQLFNLLKDVGSNLDLNIDWKPSGGCCDGNNLSAQGLPVIDTLGVRGGNIHSSEEYMYSDSLIERSKLSALLLMRLAEGDIKKFKDA